MKSNKTSRFALMLILSMALLLSACAQKNANDEQGNSTEGDNAASSKDPVTLTLVTWGGELYFPQLDDAFTAKYPHIKVDWQKIGSEYDAFLRTKINAGQTPDVFVTNGGPASNAAYSEYSVDLTNDPFMDKASDYAKLPVTSEDGKIMALPFVAQTLGVIYNKKTFADAGVTAVPTTMAELADAADKLKAAGVTPFANDYKDSWELSHLTQSFFAAEAKGNPQQLVQDITDGKVAFKDMTEFPKILDYIDLTMQEGNMPAKPLELDLNGATTLIGTGKAAMLNQGDWTNDPIMQAGGPETEIGFFPVPIGDDAVKANLLVDATAWFRISKDSKYIEEAKLYLAFAQEWMNDNHNEMLTLKELNMEPRSGNQLVVASNEYLGKEKTVGWPGVYYPDGWDPGKLLQSYIAKAMTREELLDQLTSTWVKAANK
jgi:raffinose/stachyose/melibiose transport system substrate-binding protein